MKIRQRVYEKFGGLCAYTGKPLDLKWQIDHVYPKCHWKWRQPESGNCNHIDNLLPALRIINHYKRSHHLESFRQYILELHIRLKKLPRKTKVPHTISRAKYIREVAEHFGITEDKPFSGKFYFEQ